MNIHSIPLPQIHPRSFIRAHSFIIKHSSLQKLPITKTSKEEVLIRAAKLIRKQGYHQASMKDLAAACGVQPSLFYYYFESKEVLMKEVLEFSLQFFRDYALKYADADNLTPAEKIEKMVQCIGKINKHLEGGCLMGNTALEVGHTETPFLNVVRAFFEEFRAALTKVYRAKYAEPYAENLAEQVIQDVEGGVMLSVLYKDDRFMRNAFKRAKSHLE